MSRYVSTQTKRKLLKAASYPKFPRVVEPEPVGPDANHTPAVENNAGDCNGVEHGLGGELEVFLTPPEREYSETLY